MGLLEKLFGKLKKGKAKKVYMVIEGEKKEYVYVDGKLIPKERIIQVDLNTNRVVYIDLDGTIKIAEIEGPPLKAPSLEKQKPASMYV